MPEIFRTGTTSADSKVMDEILHFIISHKEVGEFQLVKYARERVPARDVIRVIEIMERSGMIKAVSADKRGLRTFSAS